MTTLDLLDREAALVIVGYSSAWLLLGLAAMRPSLHRPARAHAILLTAMIAAVLAPLATLACTLAGWGMLAPRTAAIEADTTLPPLPANTPLSVEPGWLTASVLLTLWAVLSGVLLCRLWMSYRRGRVLAASALPADDIALLTPLHLAMQRLGVEHAPQVAHTAHASVPLIWCWSKRPRILVAPATAKRLGARGLFGVYCHELAHWRRRDHVWALIAEIALCLLPWHPLMWCARRRLREASEQACDAWVLAAGEKPTTYAEALLGLVPLHPRTLALAAVNGRRGLRRRITRILDADGRVTQPRLHPRSACGLGVATLILLATGALAQPRAAESLLVRISADEPDALPPMTIRNARTTKLVTLAPTELDLGVVPAGTSASSSVWLINTTGAAARITSAKASCGCTTVGGFEPTTLDPGGSMRIDLAIEAPGEPGAERTKHVTFTIEGHPALKLPIHLTAGPP